jgi:guanylate kinase
MRPVPNMEPANPKGCIEKMDDMRKWRQQLVRQGGRLIVVSGPSGVGKGSVLKALLGSPDCPPGLVKCVTATTRPPRENEVDGRDRHFLSAEEFAARRSAGYFLETAAYDGYDYGTPLHEVEGRRAAGMDVILEIEVQGAREVRRRFPDALFIFLAPPSTDELSRRLRGRGANDEEDIRRRLAIAEEEMRAAPEYDYLVVNDTIQNAAAELRSIIIAERCRIARRPEPPCRSSRK